MISKVSSLAAHSRGADIRGQGIISISQQLIKAFNNSILSCVFRGSSHCQRQTRSHSPGRERFLELSYTYGDSIRDFITRFGVDILCHDLGIIRVVTRHRVISE